MATPDELREDLAAARAELQDAIAGAAGYWGQKPASGEGEAAWSPRQAAEHVVPTEGFYTNALCRACGYPGIDRVVAVYPTAADAENGLVQEIAASDGKLKHVAEKDLELKHERLGNVEGILRQMVSHARDHAQQIRATANR